MTDNDVLYWDSVAKTWQAAQSQTLWREHSDAINSALLARWLPEGRAERLLKTDMFDESVGSGLYSALAARARNVIGIDLSLSTAQVARTHHHGMQAINADVRFLPFANGAFDVVVSNSTLDHFKTPQEIVGSLLELKRVLRRDGLLLLTLDNPVNPVIALRSVLPFELLRRLGILPYYVGATFGPRRLRNVLAELDFQVIEVESIMHCPRIIAVVMAKVISRYTKVRNQEHFLCYLSAFERLSGFPTRFMTGYFTAIKALKC